MPGLRPPCWPSRTLSHFDEQEPSAISVKAVSRKSAKSGKAGSIVAKPTSAEYAFDGASGFLDVLEAVAEQIPLPGVATAVKIAKNIMQACDDSHATLERAEELKQRIKILVTVLVDELKGKKGEEIQAELQKDIEALSNDLGYIYEKINDIASQNALLLIVFRSLNEDKVKKCVGRLEHSLENFTLVRQINDAKLLNALEQEILAFHASYQKSLDSMKGKVDHIHATLDDVKAILEERRDLPATSTSRPRLRSAVPAKSSVFHGRDLLVDELVQILTSSNSNSPKRPHICLLGPGGMGKTSTALAVMAHPDTSKTFSQENLIWVPCVKATSYSLFLDTLYYSLGTKQNTGDPRRDIIAEIKACKDAVVLLLDNFETPWNLIESRTETEELLNEIGEIPQATLFVTMRSSNPPGNDKQWRWFNLEAVDEIAARRIYDDIYSAGSNDQELSALLEILGHMPLAITLMANTARMTRLGAEELMEEYKRIGTAMLGQGTDAKHSLDVCINLSIQSPPMKKHPEAYSLLETLTMMPVGTTYDALKKWWACDSPNLIGALQVLGENALVQRRDARYSVLPVIRSYLLDPSRFSSHVRSATLASACKFLTQHSSSPGDNSFKEHISMISAEEENLQAILLGAVNPQPSLIEAMLVLVQHQLLTRPRLEVIEHAVGLARKIEGDQTLLAEALSCYGKILHNFDRYDQAEEQFLLARQIFLSIPDKRQAARCSLNLIPLYTERDANGFEQKLELALEAKSVFEELGDDQGVALSLYSLGMTYGQEPDGLDVKGIEFLTSARDMFKNLGDSLNHAKCTYFLEQIYYWDERYDEALTTGRAAVKEHEDIGQYAGDPMMVLGRALFMKEMYQNALDTFVRTLEICKSYGRPADIAQALEMIGRTWARLDRKADAKGAYAEAMRYYGAIQMEQGEQDIKRCRFLIRQAEDPLLIPTDEDKEALLIFYNGF